MITSSLSGQAVILAGGMGTRLGKLTKICPKPLLTIGGEPFLNILLIELIRNGLESIIVSAGFLGNQIDEYIRNWNSSISKKCRIEVIIEQDALGTGGALGYISDHLQSEFVLLNGDSWFNFDLHDFVTRPFDDGCLIKLALREVIDSSRYGVVELSGNQVIAFSEKGAKGAGLISAGVYHMKKEALSRIKQVPCSLENDILPRIVSEGRVCGYSYDGYFIDIGVPESYERAKFEIPGLLHR